MKRLLKIEVLLFALILGMGAVSSCGGGGQTSKKARVSGTILDSNAKPIGNALVTITSIPQKTNADPTGYFLVEVEMGEHAITVSVGDYTVSKLYFTVSDESPVDLGEIVPTNPYYFGGATWYKDFDGDLYSDGINVQSDIPVDGYDLAANLKGTMGDCNDADESVNPGAAEICNDIDDDCDTIVDEDFTTLGNSCSMGVGECTSPGSYICSADGSDVVCDATPGTPVAELCDGLDNDCDGLVDEDFTALGESCTAGVGVCSSAGSNVCSVDGSGIICDAVAGTGVPELCDGLDNDCDGSIDEDFTALGESCTVGVGVCSSAGSNVCSVDGSGVICDAVAGSGGPELCDGLDNDCDGFIDEDFVTTFYLDSDGDGYGLDSNSVVTCSVPDGYVSDNSDCDDSNALINPDSVWYKDADGDGYTDFSTVGPQCPRPADYLLEMELASLSDPDCNDNDPGINPGAADIPRDGVDQDCDGRDAGYEAIIPGGCFEMGDAFDEGDSDELPVHTVCITGFFMDMHEVTNSEYKGCVDAGACSAPSSSGSLTRTSYYGDPTYDNFPVIYVTWDQANAYCMWTGKRLPTEAEWEYAARGGLSGNRYAWGDTISGADANYINSGDAWDNETCPVENYAPNGYGLYDVLGNVHEWVNDSYSSDYYSVSPVDDPQGPVKIWARVLRGEAFDAPTQNLRVANRHYDSHTLSYWNIGFRCARY